MANKYRGSEGAGAKATVLEYIKTIGGFILLLIIIRFYVFQPFTISGSSMEPSFFDKEYIIVNELSYHFGNPKRGDVVIFKHPEPACTEFVNSNYFNRVFLPGPCQNYIKRVVGLPEETVIVKDGKISIKNKENPQGLILSEDYISANIPTLGNQEMSLGKNEFFVLGDNRNPNASSDSREWGVLPRSHIIGKSAFILFPPGEFEVTKKPGY